MQRPIPGQCMLCDRESEARALGAAQFLPARGAGMLPGDHRPDVQGVHERLWELLPLPGLT
jgi:hypothetical protein